MTKESFQLMRQSFNDVTNKVNKGGYKHYTVSVFVCLFSLHASSFGNFHLLWGVTRYTHLSEHPVLSTKYVPKMYTFLSEKAFGTHLANQTGCSDNVYFVTS